MFDTSCVHLRCSGGEEHFYIVIDGERNNVPECRKVVLTRRFDRDVREHLLNVMKCVIRTVRQNGAMRITVDPELEHELNIQNLGFDPESQTLIAA